MTSKFIQAVLAGLVATAIMTGFGLLSPSIGLPKMNPAEMLSGMLSVSIAIGYIIHFMIGIIFAGTYVYWFNPAVNIHSKFWKGTVFGIAVFVFAQLMLFLIGLVVPMPAMEGNMMLMMVASLIGHMVYGITVGLVVPLKMAAKNAGRYATTES